MSACGAGYVAAAARDRGADAVGVDFSASQVRLAEQTYPGIRFVEGDAEALPFEDGEFAAVLNAFGLPHIPDADKAAAEARRVLKPGGRFAYATWGDPAKCIGFSMVYDAVRAHGSMDVGLPPGPNFFRYGDPNYARELLGGAGFADVSIKEVPLVWRAASPDTVVEGLARGTVRAAAVIKRRESGEPGEDQAAHAGSGDVNIGKPMAAMRCHPMSWSWWAASRDDADSC